MNQRMFNKMTIALISLGIAVTHIALGAKPRPTLLYWTVICIILTAIHNRL